MIEVQNLTKRYGSHCAVQDISFRVEDCLLYTSMLRHAAAFLIKHTPLSYYEI